MLLVGFLLLFWSFLSTLGRTKCRKKDPLNFWGKNEKQQQQQQQQQQNENSNTLYILSPYPYPLFCSDEGLTLETSAK